MAEPVSPDVIVYFCTNSVGKDFVIPRQWKQDGAHVVVRVVPCSGKLDAQYLFHALEGGGYGICVAACPEGQCKLMQGNYRARVRVATVGKLLGEMGLESERAQLVCAEQDESAESFLVRVREAVTTICALGKVEVAT